MTDYAPNADPVLIPLRADQLDTQQRVLYDEILGGRAALTTHTALTGPEGQLLGPFDPLLRSLEVGAAVQQLGLALRHKTTLPAVATEAAILTVAISSGAEFEWYAHSAIVRSRELLSEDDITRIREVRIPQDEDAALAWELTQVLLTHSPISADQKDRALARWQERGLVELVCMVGHYSNLAILLCGLNILPPAPTDFRA